MFQGIDHLVIAVPDLEAAQKNFTALGFNVVKGGKHPTGSYNMLVGFADGAYLELLAFYEENEGHKWWTKQEGGLIDYCLQTNDIDADAAALRQAGAKMGEVYGLSRLRPDGFELDWVLVSPEDEQSGFAPFLIRDKTPREERVPQQNNHPNGITGIHVVTIATHDINMVSGWFVAGCGRAGVNIVREDLGATGVRYMLGAHKLDVIQPALKDSPLHSYLADWGPSIYSATFRSSRQSGVLDAGLAFGAKLEVVKF